jgi:hypothetical protein
MDYMGILKEGWDVTRRNKRLWILGLFAGGSAAFSSSNWNSSSSSSGNSQGLPAGWENIHTPTEALQRGLDLAGKQLGVSMGTAEQWWAFIAFAALAMLVVCLVMWAIGIAARGGLIAQTREAIAGRPTSAATGWRAGLRLWGRVFAVGFLLALPLIGLGILGLITLVAFGVPALIASGGASALAAGGAPSVTAGLVGMGLVLSLLGLIGLVIGLLVSILEEVALRHAILDGRGALDSIKATWADLKAKRGVASMWLVMILVNIAAGIAGAILVIPVLVVLSLVVGASVFAGGAGMFWLIVPAVLVLFAVGMLFKAVYATFRNTAWTSFYERMQNPELPAAAPAA